MPEITLTEQELKPVLETITTSLNSQLNENERKPFAQHVIKILNYLSSLPKDNPSTKLLANRMYDDHLNGGAKKFEAMLYNSFKYNAPIDEHGLSYIFPGRGSFVFQRSPLGKVQRLKEIHPSIVNIEYFAVYNNNQCKLGKVIAHFNNKRVYDGYSLSVSEQDISTMNDFKDVAGALACAVFNDGKKVVVFKNKQQLEKAKTSAQKDSKGTSGWDKDCFSMCAKSALHLLYSLLLSDDFDTDKAYAGAQAVLTQSLKEQDYNVESVKTKSLPKLNTTISLSKPTSNALPNNNVKSKANDVASKTSMFEPVEEETGSSNKS